MEKEINIAEILKDKPNGTKLYSPIFGDVTFDKVEKDLGKYTIFVTTKGQVQYSFMEDGRYSAHGEIMLFPSKEMRNWKKFAWKKGTVLASHGTQIMFDSFIDDTYTLFKGKHCLEYDPLGYKSKEFYRGDWESQLTKSFEISEKCVALEYIKNIEERLGGKLNLETLEVEKVRAVFKDGDILYAQSFNFEYILIFCSHNPNSIYKDEYAAYVSLSDKEICYEEIHDVIDYGSTKMVRLATEEEKQKLFDALAKEGKRWNTDTKQVEDIKPKWAPKPFDRVVAFSCADNTWYADIYSHVNSMGSYNCLGGTYKTVLPYNEGTAKLVGTTDSYTED